MMTNVYLILNSILFATEFELHQENYKFKSIIKYPHNIVYLMILQNSFPLQ